ncbi:MAG TPA: BadF/BadG/BcrA/BcrD ATPase family protein [Streptosporangiaceae bacterium]|nr:BadF/BadG/BcrA/BcrD ATPase family protein [Streptosporangiaceae bacterium]
MKYFLGVDVGGSKTHALIADETGQGVGFGSAGPGNWESVGYDGLTEVLLAITAQALEMAGMTSAQIAGAGLGLAGYDWPCQRQAHLDAIRPLKLKVEPQIVNDATLGILAGAEAGWGVSVVSGTGCNCRGWSRDHTREGRGVGGANHWSGEAAGGWDIAARAMRAVAFEWTRRGPATALTPAFLQLTGAKDLDDLVEGMYLGRYDFDQSAAPLVFEIAARGDSQALEVVRWAGEELGQMACGVINQLDIRDEAFDVVLIGSLFDGHPLLAGSLGETVHRVAPRARLVRLDVPPVVGGVLLGMESAGIDFHDRRPRLIQSTNALLDEVLP